MDVLLRKIAMLLDQEEALSLFLAASAKEEAGDLGEAIDLYRKAFRRWPALESVEDDGLPVAVRREAVAAGLDLVALSQGAAMHTEPSPRFELENEEEWLAYLDEHGYCVLAGLAGDADIQRAHDLLWAFLEAAPGTPVRRDDPATWDGPDWKPSASNGLLGGGGFGQSDFAWHTRLLPGVRKAFSKIWNCDDLIVSFDGGNVFRPWQRKPEWRTEGSWWHIDQNAFPDQCRQRPVEGRSCVQGFVSHTRATATTGGLCVVPGSHKSHIGVCERACSSKLPGHFVPVHAADPALQAGTKLVCAKAGDLVLWDSRCIHCNTPGVAGGLKSDQAHSELLRVVAYICMTPAAWASQEVLLRRRRGFLENASASHLPDDMECFVAGPEWMPRRKWREATIEQRRLIG